MEREKRNLLGQPVEVTTAGERRRAEGYAAVFGRRSHPLGGFVEQVAPSAFNKALKDGGDVMALFNHRMDHLLGRTSSGTLVLEVDERGLRYSVDLPDTQLGRDLGVLLERRDITGSSFTFGAIRDSWDELEDGTPLRTLEEVRIFDVGPVSEPAYPDATAALRSLAQSRSLDLEVLVEAHQKGDLRSLIHAPAEEAAGEAPSGTEERGTPRRRSHLAI